MITNANLHLCAWMLVQSLRSLFSRCLCTYARARTHTQIVWMCVLFACHCTIMGLLYKSCPPAVVQPTPVPLPLSLFQVQCRFSNAITQTIWWEHQLNCCCFSAVWPARRSSAHTPTCAHAQWLACVQTQTKPYGPSITSFTVRNPSLAEGQEESAASIFAGCRTQREGRGDVTNKGLWSGVSIDPSFPASQSQWL